MMEWLEGEKKPTKLTLTSLRRRMSKKPIVRAVKERYRTEQANTEPDAPACLSCSLFPTVKCHFEPPLLSNAGLEKPLPRQRAAS